MSERPSSSEKLPTAPPEAWEPLLRLARFAGRPLERFLRIEAASGILLLAASLVALLVANSSYSEIYFRFWHTPLSFGLGKWSFSRPLEWWVNDALMVIFFFVVGMEIRREVHHGELSEPKRAAIPLAAAFGGMLAPAGLYLIFAGKGAAHSGWGVPMATDIAFAVGILALLGKRVPPALRVLLLALAVIDDLGAILVIALFYSTGLNPFGFVVALSGFAGIFAMQWLAVRSKWLYVLPSLVAWAGIYAAGVHPTIAGVIVGLLTPVRAWLGTDGFATRVRKDLDHLGASAKIRENSREIMAALRHVDEARREAMSPAESLIENLHPWVAFGIMPLFALANAGVAIQGGGLSRESLTVSFGVAMGLVIGKPLGILLACAFAVAFRLGVLPIGIGFRHLTILGVVAGVGFTMALFIAQLAFIDSTLLAGAKVGVLSASAGAAVLALVLGVLFLPKIAAEAATSADEAESSTER